VAEAGGEPWLQRQPTREDVRACYLFILGRPPEDESVLDRTVAQLRTIAELRRRFFLSDEFRAGEPQRDAPPATLRAAGREVESEADPEQLARMLERTGRYWARIGKSEPWWSVLTQERFRAARIAETRGAFYQSGAVEAALLRSILERAGLSPAALPLCVEFGCGTGRVTVHLARLFARVIGCDISVPHLALAGRVAVQRGLGNIEWHRSTAEAPMPEALRWDVWFSRIVLQHNPPPVIAHLLRQAFAGLAPGGVAVFQVPTFRLGYSFSTADYLDNPAAPVMEMHALPQRAVFALARQAGLEALEVLDDIQANPAQATSNIFVFRRSPA
jgi:SAM-dependent methyltransferase